MDFDFVKDIRYGEHERNFVDITFPKGAKGNVDLVLMIHGGAWTAGDKSTYHTDISQFAADGVVSASMNYRYISENSNGFDILDDITSALRVIKAEGAKRGINIEKALLTGLSAGGHLSLLYAYSRVDEAPIRPVAVVALSGPADMAGEEAVKAFMHDNEMGGSEVVAGLLSMLSGFRTDTDNYKTEASVAANRKISPVYYVNKDTVPTVICHAVNDRIVPFCNAVILEKALAENGVEHEFIVYPTSGHALEKDPDCTRKANELTDEYIRRYLSVYKEK